LLLASIGLGAFFVIFQGVEWVALIREGLTLTSSHHGSFFYLIVGLHALHAVGAITVLAWVWLRLQRGRLTASRFYAAQIFWYFVVGLWPILYLRVYL
jgi:heme/copper-type cytochrome/quinol oxidase subunit 3